MPFYTYVSKDGEEIEKLFSMSERPDTITENGKTFERKQEFASTFILKGYGWASKGTGTAPTPKKSKAEVGIAVNHDLKKAMKDAGEKV